MKIKYLLPLLLFLVASQSFGGMKRILLKWDDPMIASGGHQGEIFQVGAVGHKSVHQFTSSKNRYIWKSALDGFFLLKVSPLNSDGLVVSEEIQEKKIFISNPPDGVKFLRQYLCEEDYRYDWNKAVGKAKYLLRLYDMTASRVVYRQLSRSNQVSFQKEMFVKGHRYHFSVIEGRVGGEVRLGVNRYLDFRACDERPQKVLPPLTKMGANIYYTPRYSIHKQEGSSTLGSEPFSYVSFGGDFESPRLGKSSYWGRFDYHSYNRPSGSIFIEEISAEVLYKRHMGVSWTLLAGLEYEDFGSFNSEAEAVSGSILEDRHRLVYGELGAIKLFWPLDKRLEVKFVLGYSVYSSTIFGDAKSSKQSVYTGHKFKLVTDLYLTQNFFIKGGIEGRVLSGNDNYSRYDIFFGPGVSY